MALINEGELVKFLNVGKVVVRNEFAYVPAADVGTSKTFFLDNRNVVPTTLVLYYGDSVDSLTLIPDADYTVNYEEGSISFSSVPSYLSDKKLFATYLFVPFNVSILTDAVSYGIGMAEYICKTKFDTSMNEVVYFDVDIKGEFVDLHLPYVPIISINSVSIKRTDTWEDLVQDIEKGYTILNYEKGIIRIYGYYGSQTFKVDYNYGTFAYNPQQKSLALYLAIEHLLTNPVYAGTLTKGFDTFENLDLGSIRTQIERLSMMVGRWS